MNHHEIEACVIRAKGGNQEDLLKLITQFKPFIFKTASKFHVKNYDNSDLVQLGYIALINAVMKYKIGNHTFTSYAFNAIKNSIRYTARQNNKYSSEVSLNSTINDSQELDIEFVESIESPLRLEEELLKEEAAVQVREALKQLDAEELELIIMIYYSEMPLKAYAEKKQIDYQQAVYRKKKTIKKLRRFMKAHTLS